VLTVVKIDRPLQKPRICISGEARHANARLRRQSINGAQRTSTERPRIGIRGFNEFEIINSEEARATPASPPLCFASSFAPFAYSRLHS
jgi:hypothetical protein